MYVDPFWVGLVSGVVLTIAVLAVIAVRVSGEDDA